MWRPSLSFWHVRAKLQPAVPVLRSPRAVSSCNGEMWMLTWLLRGTLWATWVCHFNNWCQSWIIQGMHWYSHTAPPPFFFILVSCLRCGFSPGCRAGTFGPHCKSRCSCINGGRCDFRTGTCHCPPGFIGANCSLSKSGNPLYWKIVRQNELEIFSVRNVGICSCAWMKTCLFLQVVWVDSTGRTALNCAPVGKEGSATQLLGSASVPLVGWDSPANKVTPCWCLWLLPCAVELWHPCPCCLFHHLTFWMFLCKC